MAQGSILGHFQTLSTCEYVRHIHTLTTFEYGPRPRPPQAFLIACLWVASSRWRTATPWRS